MAGFVNARLADVAEVKGGKRLPANANLVTTPTSHPYIRGRDIRDGKITFDDPMYVLDEDFEKIKRYTVDSGDVCITIVGNIGDVGITPPNLHCASLTENAVKLVNLREDIDALFLMYALLTPDAQSQMKLSAAGAAQPKLGIYKVNEIKVPAPPLPIQRRIAGILSAYDELIENSQRRIKILEAMARALYREWFVHFRFPGHESVPRVPSPLGEIPQGWEVKKLGGLLNVDKGVSYNGAGLTEDGNPMVNLKNIQAGGGFRRDATKPYSGDFKPRHTVMPGDVVLANTDLTQAGNVVASPALIPRLPDDKPILISHHLYAVRPVEGIPPLFVYHLMLTDDFRGFAKGFAIGTTVLGLPKEGILNYSFACPTLALVRSFIAQVSAIHELVEALHDRIQNLRRTRDLLLPRLLSGQIDVEGMPS
jgi:type I restriction enzyme S subunit